MPQFIRFNLFPLEARVYDKDGQQVMTHKTTRTIVTDDEIYVYIDDASGPKVWFQDRLEDFTGDARTGWTADTSEEFSVKINRSGSCGCGSRLKGFNPFPGLPYEKMTSQ